MGLKDLAGRLFPSPVDVEEDYGYGSEIDDGAEQFDETRSTSVHAQENVYAPRSSAQVSMIGGSSIEMKVVTPKSYDTVTQIADLLLSKKTVLLNLENTNRETARRLIDFLSGAAYALGGGVQKVADNTYAITPSNVAVSRENVGMAQAQAQQTETEEIQNDTVSF